MHLLPVQDNPSVIRRMHTGKNFHQRRFSRAVFAAQRTDSPATHGKRHVAQSGDRAKTLRDTLHSEEIIWLAIVHFFVFYVKFFLREALSQSPQPPEPFSSFVINVLFFR